jgi:hypothetical protein
MKQVLHLEKEKDVLKRNIYLFVKLLDKVERSEHWFDYDSLIKRIHSIRPKEEAPLDDFEVFAMLQDRLSLSFDASCDNEENPASEDWDEMVIDFQI